MFLDELCLAVLAAASEHSRSICSTPLSLLLLLLLAIIVPGREPAIELSVYSHKSQAACRREEVLLLVEPMLLLLLLRS